MIFEVFSKGRTIGFVVANNTLESAKLVADAFPQVDKVNRSYSLPKNDPRCKKITEKVYAWV